MTYNEFEHSKWISHPSIKAMQTFIAQKQFSIKGQIKNARLHISAKGLYAAFINGERIGDFVLAPGWTSRYYRFQYQSYDVSDLINSDMTVEIMAAPGWACGQMGYRKDAAPHEKPAVIAHLHIELESGGDIDIYTDENWHILSSPVLKSGIYYGEYYDATLTPALIGEAVPVDVDRDLVPTQGEKIIEHERIAPVDVLSAPDGSTILDFGQNITGYIEFTAKVSTGGGKGIIHHAEMLKDGDLFRQSLRTADQEICYIFKAGEQTYKPLFTFMGFRYIKLCQWQGEINPCDFRAVVVYSDIKRTGYFECSNELINKFYDNVLRSQRGNFLDVPTDCPQRDERLGWTGDAQVFIKTACYNYNVERFFDKWLCDLSLDQHENGAVPSFSPDIRGLSKRHSAAWGDAITICPWQLYLSYGDKHALWGRFAAMHKWVTYLRNTGEVEYEWTGGDHFGDWLAMDSKKGDKRGGTDPELIAQAFFARSTELLIEAGLELGFNMLEYEDLYDSVVENYTKRFMRYGFPVCKTQTAYILTLQFNLCPESDKPLLAAGLARLVKDNGNKLATGFVGTPYILHALSDNGQAETAYTLLLQKNCPSWLYPVTMGATTIWEHWDALNPDGSINESKIDMLSFNHYAYGAAVDWLYGVMAGINPDPSEPGYKNILFRPVYDKRIDYVKASLETKYGIIRSEWEICGNKITYTFEVPEGCTAEIDIGGEIIYAGHGVHTQTADIPPERYGYLSGK